jgi:hypothetical protein
VVSNYRHGYAHAADFVHGVRYVSRESWRIGGIGDPNPSATWPYIALSTRGQSSRVLEVVVLAQSE